MAKAKDPFALKINDADLRGLLRSFSKMDDIAKNDMKQIAAKIASKNAQAVAQAASSAPNPRQAQAVVSSIEVVASSKDQVALEGYKGHGVFTYTMMEALDGKLIKMGKSLNIPAKLI
jgi:nucleoid DNA-binding protein